jgi:4-amino-4-deoxy-L-arabinose transferase-like glycosyltransferase
MNIELSKSPRFRSLMGLLFEKAIFVLIIFYLTTRLVNLTLLPIFNDEAIYLHWGLIELSDIPRYLYYSLYDGKQPLLMWVFGAMQRLTEDPLLAGRLVSVATGLLTMIGLYELGKRFFGRGTGVLAALIYIIIPIFAFYDRQALMESSVACIGVWMCYWFLRNIECPRYANIFWLGFLIGLGLFIKSSVSIFLANIILIGVYVLYINKNRFFRRKYVIISFGSLGLALLIIAPLISQPDFMKIITMNSRYSFTLNEILQFPWIKWLQNVQSTVELLWWYVTPFLFAACIYGVGIMYKMRKGSSSLYVILWFILPLLFFILFTENPSSRYIVAFLPLVTIFCAQAFLSLNKRILPWVFFVSFLFPLIHLVLLLFSPLNYFYSMERFTKYSDSMDYVRGPVAGYGVVEVAKYLSDQAKGGDILVEMKNSNGNPEDSLYLYLRLNHHVSVLVRGFDCENYVKRSEERDDVSGQPIYFVSRDYGLDDNKWCLREMKKFYKPGGKSFFGVYKLIRN